MEEPLLLGHEYFRIRGLTAGGATKQLTKLYRS